jgi:peptide/nickel transport system ATP-binding protein
MKGVSEKNSGMTQDGRNDLLLAVRGLRTRFFTYEGQFDAVNGVDLNIRKNESVGLVGETGCGKSVTALSIMRLIQYPPGKIISGSITFNGEDIMTKSEAEMRMIRGGDIAMIFQKPMSALNPTYKIGTQMVDIIRLHQQVDRKTARERAIELLASVKISGPDRIVNRYPHELSGGMRQRVMIATALSSRPDLLIADEPTTALDATIQKQILKLIEEIRNELGFSMLFISHDLRTVYNVSNRLCVMYAGNVVEFAETKDVIDNPRHPYFQGLIGSLPRFGAKKEKLAALGGTVPSLLNPPPGCRFHPRCKAAINRCRKDVPQLTRIEDEHWVSCHRAKEGVALV